MRTLLFTALALLQATTVEARPSTLGMTCAEAAATVASYGAAVLTTGEFTYDRFVAHIGFCLPNEAVKPAFAPTLDAESCNVGYVCEEERRVPDDDP
jgi:hypothetical protein